MFNRFQNGPCGILVRCSSPNVSASAPHEQIHPQYEPFPQNQIMSGMITSVCTAPMMSQSIIGCSVNTFQTKSGQASTKPKARQYSRPCESHSLAGKS